MNVYSFEGTWLGVCLLYCILNSQVVSLPGSKLLCNEGHLGRFSTSESYHQCVIFLYTEILEVNSFAFAYRLFPGDFSPLDGISVCNII